MTLFEYLHITFFIFFFYIILLEAYFVTLLNSHLQAFHFGLFYYVHELFCDFFSDLLLLDYNHFYF